MTSLSLDVVVPTTLRPSLATLLSALAASGDALPGRVLVVTDGDRGAPPALPPRLAGLVETISSPGRGPAAARNAGWRASSAEWIAFLDDDVVPPQGWAGALARDLAGLPGAVAGSQGRVRVPLPARPTDWERNVSGLENARWATADMTLRRAALAAVGGFDERFRRAYREDSDLGLRLAARGYRIVAGERWVSHPVGDASFWKSVQLQAGNADDALMAALHGRRWREAAGAPRGRRRRHLAVSAAAAVGLWAGLTGARTVAAASLAAWAAATVELGASRIGPGPRDPAEVARMIATSAVLPAAASAWWLAGWARVPLQLSRPGPGHREVP